MGISDRRKKQRYAGKIKRRFGINQNLDLELPELPVRMDDSNISHFDINIKTLICFRELGLGHSAIENFLRHMNMPPPFTKIRYENIIYYVHPLYLLV